ncbi:hypothetical protein R6Q59_010434 [Mikania micrantha]
MGLEQSRWYWVGTLGFSYKIRVVSSNFSGTTSSPKSSIAASVVSSLQTILYHSTLQKGHPKAESLRTSPLPFLDLCAALFIGNTATGNCKWSSTQTTSIVGSSSINRVQYFLLMDTEDDAGTSQHNTPDPNTDPSFEPTCEPSREPSPKPNSSKRLRTSKSSSISADDLANDMKKALQYLIKGKEGPTILECSKKLKLVGLDPVDPIFLTAYHIFGVSTSMREA